MSGEVLEDFLKRGVFSNEESDVGFGYCLWGNPLEGFCDLNAFYLT